MAKVVQISLANNDGLYAIALTDDGRIWGTPNGLASGSWNELKLPAPPPPPSDHDIDTV